MKRLNLFKTNNSNSKIFIKWLDRLTFFKIFLLWTLIILIFGFIYHFSANQNQYLIRSTGGMVDSLFDSIYFSFISSTTTGFGDISPIGYFKVLTIVEIVIGLILLAFVTSRLVSIKQNVILDQIYDISLSDNVGRLRLALSNFVNKLNEATITLQTENTTNRLIQDIYFYLLQFDDIVKKITTMSSTDGKIFQKSLNYIDNELLIYSLLNAIEKIDIFLEIGKQSKNINSKLVKSKRLLNRTYLKVEKFLDSFQDLDGEMDFENFQFRKTTVLNSFKKNIKVREKKKSK